MSTKPNGRLRNARLARLSPSGSGEPMSPRELAETVNAYLSSHGPQRYEDQIITDRYIRRYESGAVTWPNKDIREALRAVLEVDNDAALGFHIKRKPSQQNLLRQPADRDEQTHPGGSSPPKDHLPPMFETTAADKHIAGRAEDSPMAVSSRVHSDCAEVDRSQEEWRKTRRDLNFSRVRLALSAASLYDPETRFPGTGLLIHPDWLPERPVSLWDIKIKHDDTRHGPVITGVEDFTSHVRPLVRPSRRFHRYSQAIRTLDHPLLFENRMAWRLQEVAWSRDSGHLTFGDTSYFESVDVCEALAHETAASLVEANGSIAPASWHGMTLRRAIGDPFDLARRLVGASTDTLTIRQDRDGSTFVLHDRKAGKVAMTGGTLHVMPCGVFQPSSIRPASQNADFDLWRNIMREYSEEFLGNPEHDGDGEPIDYAAEPFGQLMQAVAQGKVRVFCLGVGLDALTLYGEILTVAVFDGDVYDAILGDMIDVNDEGSLVKTGIVHPTPAIPFTEHMVRELIDSGRMAPAAAGCLQLAWDHRRTVLGN